MRRATAARACLPRLALEGATQARLESLAADAGLTRQTLLFYFADKADLWAEAATVAAETICEVVTRRVKAEQGPVVIRALRRSLDEVRSVSPDAFAVLLDASGAPPRPGVAQRARNEAVHDRLLSALTSALTGSRGDRESARRLGQLAWLSLLAHHREARAHARSGLGLRPQLPADLDFAEGQLVALAQSQLPRR